MKNVIVYVDGFNLYHALDDLGDDSLKWLCLRRLSQSILRADETLKEVKYFSAYAKWIPEAMLRHKTYVTALQAEGVTFIPGQFKKKFLRCKVCGAQYQSHEEKETDVNIAIHLVRDAFASAFDRAIVISADTDMRTAVEMARGVAAGKAVDVVAPPDRFGRARSLRPLFALTVGKIRAARLQDSYDLPDGNKVTIPAKYRQPQ